MREWLGTQPRRRCLVSADGALPSPLARRHQPPALAEIADDRQHYNDDDGNFDYIAGVEVSDFSGLPSELSHTRIPEQRYAVFLHSDHISTIRRTVNTIWNRWLPNSEYRAADTPDFERYGPEFDPETGNGGVEIWVPIEN